MNWSAVTAGFQAQLWSRVAAMERLTPEEFEGMQCPAFKEDEKTLVLAGAALGFLIGELQVRPIL